MNKLYQKRSDESSIFLPELGVGGLPLHLGAGGSFYGV
jgi:hypothetical protein